MALCADALFLVSGGPAFLQAAVLPLAPKATPREPAQRFKLCQPHAVVEQGSTWDKLRKCRRETRRGCAWDYVPMPYCRVPGDPQFYQAPFQHLLPRALRGKPAMELAVAQGGKNSTLGKGDQIVEGARLIDGA